MTSQWCYAVKLKEEDHGGLLAASREHFTFVVTQEE
jgi:hypothetical protein